jgi:hypothetical protein
MSSAHERYFSHELFAEQQTLAALQPGGAWHHHTEFLVRSCVNIQRNAEPNYGQSSFLPLPEIDAELPDNNNCRYATVEVVHPASAKAYAVLLNTLKGNSSLSLSESDCHFWGSTKNIGVKAEFGTDNYFDLAGAHSATSANVKLEGWLNASIFDLTADANALVSVVDSGVDFKVAGFGHTLFSYAKEVPEVHFSKKWDVSKKTCATFSYGIYIVSLNVDTCAIGSLGFETDLSITAQEGAGSGIFAESASVGLIEPEVRPFLDFDGSASAYANVEVARAGVEADFALLDQSLPVDGTLRWGLNDESSLLADGRIQMKAELDSLSGKISAFADVHKIKWCKKWGVRYPCGAHWHREATKTIVSWKGKEYGYTLLDRSKQFSIVK